MTLRLQTLWERLRASLWALPLGMMLLAAALAVAALELRLDVADDGVWWLYSGTAKEAPNFLATLVGSMITMGTLSLSLTMVVLTLAVQQLGPRLIHHFMTSRRTQVSVGLFLSTVVYLLLVLRAVHGQASGTEVPNLAVTIGSALVLASVITLLFFTHHLARSIVADAVIDGVGASLDASAVRLLPSKTGVRMNPSTQASRAQNGGAPLGLSRGGYIQAVDHQRLVECARTHGAVITLLYRPGHHVLAHAVHALITPAPALTRALQRSFDGAILLGRERTPDQDLEFQIRQLVEIALRALSPGVNDTYTAVAVINRLALSLALIMQCGPPQSAWRDQDNTVRLVIPVSTFEGMMDAAFDQIRQASGKLPAVLIHIVETLGQLATVANDLQRESIAAHLTRIAAAGHRAIEDEHDLASFKSRLRSAEAALRENTRARADIL